MKISGANKAEGFIEYTDRRGLTDKAIRVLNLCKLIGKVRSKIREEIKKLSVTLITDPALVITDKRLNDLDEAVGKMLESWNKIGFPFQQDILIRTCTFKNIYDFSLPTLFLPVQRDVPEFSKSIRKGLIEINNPEQVIIHPRIKTEDAKKKLIALRVKSLPGSVECEFAKGVEHIKNAEEAKIRQIFKLSGIDLENINPEFLVFAKAAQIVATATDYYFQYETSTIEPHKSAVYEFKCFSKNGKHTMILFDYEVV
ncbi:hypothetical protein JW796_04210 [Candidatus Dojkabacteria bacterium]|nr:hypothetical protein [Candidatus Dojkabacteria bacterium]